MAGMSRYIEQGLFDRTLNPATRVDATFLAVHTGAVDDESYGSEATYTGYERQGVDSMYTTIEDVGGGTLKLVAKNGAAVTFPVSEGPLTTITHWALWDNPDAGNGNVLYSGALLTGRVIEPGDQMIVAIDALQITFT